VNVFEISTGLSLSVILGVLVITVVASLVSPKGRAQNAVSGARRHATQYIDTSFETDPQLRSKIWDRLVSEEETIRGLPEKYRARIREEEKLARLLEQAHAEHEAYLQQTR
jgi:tellurite resistance protein TerC